MCGGLHLCGLGVLRQRRHSHGYVDNHTQIWHLRPHLFFPHKAATKETKVTSLLLGGLYNQSEGCLPYAVEPCDRNNKTRNGELRPLCGPDVDTPQCQRKCRKGYNTTFKDDKYHGFQVYEVVPKVTSLSEMDPRFVWN